MDKTTKTTKRIRVSPVFRSEAAALTYALTTGKERGWVSIPGFKFERTDPRYAGEIITFEMAPAHKGYQSGNRSTIFAFFVTR